jgi:hypothetical protein
MTSESQGDREREEPFGDGVGDETGEEREELAQRGRLQQTEEEEEEGPDEAA